MSKKSFIDSVRVASPCSEDWDEMTGNDRVRFCSHCAKDVNNLSEMTRKEATRLVRASGGNLCIRYIQDPKTKRPVFAEQLLQITRRTPQLAAGVMTASMSLSTITYAQGGVSPLPVTEPAIECPDKPAAVPEKTPSKGKLKGTITDANGAVIPYASVTIASVDAAVGAGRTASSEGVFSFDALDAGTYHVEARASGFAVGSAVVQISDGVEASADIQLVVAMAAPLEVTVDNTQYIVAGGIGFVEYQNPLASAVSDDDADLVRQLIAQGENVNGKEDEEYDKVTPLFIAVEHGNLEIVRLLLDAGAKVNVRDAEKRTPLMRLDGDATPELVELLLRHGAKVNLEDNENNTALIHAADSAPAAVIKALIDAGADVNAVNKEGETALMKAAYEESLEKVRMLLEAGAKVNLKNNDGETAWDMTSDEEIEDLLVGHGAIVPQKEEAPAADGDD